MIIIMIWIFMMFICCNHRLYRKYVEITFKTLFQETSEDLRNKYITRYLHEKKGWIN